MKQEVSAHFNFVIQNKLRGLRPHDNNLYTHVNRLTRTRETIPPLVTTNGSVAFTSMEKADCLANHFESVHQQNYNIGDPSRTANIETVVSSFMEGSDTDPEPLMTDHVEVTNIIRNLKNRKSPGFDSVRNIAVKNMSFRAILFLTGLINAMFRHKHFPDAWKTAKIVAFAKPGKPSNVAGNYRPISLLSTLSKIVEKIIANRLNEIMLRERILPDIQFGFREAHSTTHALLNLTNRVRDDMDRKRTNVLVSLDIEKAFDTIWLNGLLFKIIQKGFPPSVVRFLHAYLNNRRFRVVVNGCSSNVKYAPNGLPEGSILGPILFSIYVSDIPQLDFTKLQMFADDTSVLSSSLYPSVALARMQTHLNALCEYFTRWKMKVNAGKTEYMVFTRRRNRITDAQLFYGDAPIKRVDDMRLLGIRIDSRLNFGRHVSMALMKARTVAQRLQPLLKTNSGLSSENKVFAFKIFMRSILTYGITVWNSTSRTNMHKIQVAQNKFMRDAFNLRPHPMTFSQVNTRDLHAMAKIETIGDFNSRVSQLFYDKASGHSNPLIASLCNPHNIDTHLL